MRSALRRAEIRQEKWVGRVQGDHATHRRRGPCALVTGLLGHCWRSGRSACGWGPRRCPEAPELPRGLRPQQPAVTDGVVRGNAPRPAHLPDVTARPGPPLVREHARRTRGGRTRLAHSRLHPEEWAVRRAFLGVTALAAAHPLRPCGWSSRRTAGHVPLASAPQRVQSGKLESPHEEVNRGAAGSPQPAHAGTLAGTAGRQPGPAGRLVPFSD